MPIEPTIITNAAKFIGWCRIAPTAEQIDPPTNEQKLKPAAAVPDICFGAWLIAPAAALGRINPMPRVIINIGRKKLNKFVVKK